MGIYCLNFELFGKTRLSDGNFLFSSILEFFSELVVASFDEVFIDIFSFEEFFRSNRLLSKSGFFKDENCQNCQGYFHFFYAKHLKFHINRYSAVFSDRYLRYSTAKTITNRNRQYCQKPIAPPKRHHQLIKIWPIFSA